MHVVVINRWQEEQGALVQTLAEAMGVTAFEARQRVAGGGPAVVAILGDVNQALHLSAKLKSAGIPALVMDASAIRSGRFLMVRRFVPGERAIRVEAVDGRTRDIPYRDMKLLLPAISTTAYSETKTVTERKLSIGKTVLAGGLPVSKKVERQEVVTTEETRKVLYLYAGDGPPVLFSRDGMTYDGFGSGMKHSRELNFAFLISELRRLAPQAVYDDRLLNRGGQVRLLGPAQYLENHLELAAEILAQALQGVG